MFLMWSADLDERAVREFDHHWLLKEVQNLLEQ